jgi:hypothetical protein
MRTTLSLRLSLAAKDPIFWQNSFQLVWRNGDTVNSQGIKCTPPLTHCCCQSRSATATRTNTAKYSQQRLQ